MKRHDTKQGNDSSIEKFMLYKGLRNEEDSTKLAEQVNRLARKTKAWK